MTIKFFEEETDWQAKLIEQLGGAVGYNLAFIQDELSCITRAPFNKAKVYLNNNKAKAENIMHQRYLACFFSKIKQVLFLGILWMVSTMILWEAWTNKHKH